jgi:4-amino-4-deoxy-L-arabinose transferase-like glycosyltransferase
VTAWLWLVLALALAVRVLVIATCLEVGALSDTEEYRLRALHLLQHGTYFPDAFRPPGYPLFVAAIFAGAGGEQLLAVRFAQAVLGTVTVGLTYLLARQVARPAIALAAAIVAAVYPAWLIYPVHLLTENLFTPLAMLGLWSWLAGGMRGALIAGLAIGAACLTRGIGMALMAGVTAAALVSWIRVPVGRKVVAARLGVLWVAFALVLAPWAARNYRLYRQVILIDTSSGHNFLIGNNPRAAGRINHADVDVFYKTYWKDAPRDIDRAQVGYREGLRFIREHPRQSAWLAVRKAGYMVELEGREHLWAYSHGYFGPRSPAAVWGWGLAHFASFPPLMALAVLGLFRPGLGASETGRTVALVLAVVLLMHIATFGEGRYHLPWVPLLGVLAARGLERPTPAPPWGWVRPIAIALAMAVLAVKWGEQLPEFLERLRMLATASWPPPGLPY